MSPVAPSHPAPFVSAWPRIRAPSFAVSLSSLKNWRWRSARPPAASTGTRTACRSRCLARSGPSSRCCLSATACPAFRPARRCWGSSTTGAHCCCICRARTYRTSSSLAALAPERPSLHGRCSLHSSGSTGRHSFSSCSSIPRTVDSPHFGTPHTSCGLSSQMRRKLSRPYAA